MLISAVAAVACLAVLTVHGMGGTDSVELAERGEDITHEVEVKTSRLPSWLETAPVKLVPLDQMIQEQEEVHKMAEGKISDKLYHEEHLQDGPSPRELAMHTLHAMAERKRQSARQSGHRKSSHAAHTIKMPRSASEKASEDNLDRAQQAIVRHALAAAREKAHRSLQSKKARLERAGRDREEEAGDKEAGDVALPAAAPTQRIESRPVVRVGRTAHVMTSSPAVAQELAKERGQLARLQQDEAENVAAIKKQEVHALAQLKAKDHIKEMQLQMGIEQLERMAVRPSAAAATPAQSEKAKIKAEMAKIEAEEHHKLAALKNKLSKVGADSDAGSESESDSAAQAATARLAAVVPESKARQTQLSQLDPRKARSAGKAAAAKTPAVKGACTDNNCDLDHEDKKWLAHR